MSVSKEERETLHLMLDAMLNARDSLERIDPTKLEPGLPFSSAWSRPRKDLCLLGARLVRRALGEKLHHSEMTQLFDTELEENASEQDLLATIANSLRSFLPLFMSQGDSEWRNDDEVIVRVIEDFMGIYWGDEPRFFKVAPRVQGQHKRLYRLNKLRLSALDWDKYLAAVGMAARRRHRIISDAYRTEWDAIRKWASIVEAQYGFRSYPPRDKASARREYDAYPDFVLASIHRDGDAYWLEKTGAKSGKDTQN